MASDAALRPPCPDEARELARKLAAPVVCAFAALRAGGPAARGNPTRLRHVADALAQRMAELQLDETLRARTLAELAPFFDDATPPAPGIEGRVGIAAGGAIRFGLPFPVAPRAYVGGCLPVRALLRAARLGRPYRVLALSAGRLRVAAGDVRGLAPEPNAELPESLTDALGERVEGVGTQQHSGAAGGRHPIHHGHHDASREREVDRERFHRVVRDAVARAFAGSELPLVLVADRTHHGLLDALAGRVPLAGAVAGNPDAWNERALHERAWPVVRDATQAEQAERRRALESARGRGEAIVGLQACIEGVASGAVRRLWVPAESSVPGAIDLAACRAVAAWGDEDLLDALACEALRRGAEVEVLEPGETPFSDGDVAAERR